LKFGGLEFHVISDGRLLLDGGAMFGVVPRTLWEKKLPPDSRNRIHMAMNCVLVRAGGKNILIETGAGDKMNPKLRDIYGLDGPRLADGLREHGLQPGNIDIVINTHLHFDHAGGNTRREKDKLVATFPNARYFVQKAQYQHAVQPSERDQASYFEDDYVPLMNAGQLTLVEGDTEIVPGIEVTPLTGHTIAMQCVKLTGGGKTAFLTADLVPTTAHLPLPWIMGYDLYPLSTLETKKKWLPTIVRESWLAVFGHDATTRAAYICEKDGRFEYEPVEID